MNSFCDSHTDFMTKFNNFEEKENYVKKIYAWGAEKICSAIFTTEEKIGIEKLKLYKNEIDKINEKFDNILCFSIEDIGTVDPIDLDKVVTLAPLSVTLTWNYQNFYGGGAKCTTGLTNNGIHACKVFEKNKIFIDTAHMSKQSFDDFCKITTKPIFNSHSNIFSLCENKRNLNDDQIKQIVDSDGFMGLTFYQKFISKKQISCKDIATQFAYLSEKFGCDNFGIGSDLFGFDTKYLPIDLKSYLDIITLEVEMKKIGFLKEDIEKICYMNFLNVLTRI